jgi:hypothetical protein
MNESLGKGLYDQVNAPVRQYDRRARRKELPEYEGMSAHRMIPRQNRQIHRDFAGLSET